MSEIVTSGLFTEGIYGEIDYLHSKDDLCDAAEAAQKRYEAKHGVWETVSPPDKKSVGWWKHVRLSGKNDAAFALTLQEYLENNERDEALQQILRAYQARLQDEFNYLRVVGASNKAGEYYAHLRQLVKLRQLYILVKSIPNRFITSASIKAVKEKPEYDAQFTVSYENDAGDVIDHGTTFFVDLIAKNRFGDWSSEANLVISSGKHRFDEYGIVGTSRMTKQIFDARKKLISVSPSASHPEPKIKYDIFAFINGAVTAETPTSATEMVTPPKPKRTPITTSSAGPISSSTSAAPSSSMSAATRASTPATEMVTPPKVKRSQLPTSSVAPVRSSMSATASYKPAASSSMSAAATSKFKEFEDFNWDTPPPPMTFSTLTPKVKAAAGGGGGPGPSFFLKKSRRSSNKKRRSTRRRK